MSVGTHTPTAICHSHITLYYLTESIFNHIVSISHNYYLLSDCEIILLTYESFGFLQQQSFLPQQIILQPITITLNKNIQIYEHTKFYCLDSAHSEYQG